MYTLSKRSLLPLLLMTGNGLIASTALADSPQLNQQLTSQNFLELSELIVLDASSASQSSELDKTIFADGSEFNLDLSGQDGRDASHPAVSGWAGEPGEDGGTLTVYYTDLADLRNIYVDASGGKGGAGLPSRTTYRCPPPPPPPPRRPPRPFWEDEDPNLPTRRNPLLPDRPNIEDLIENLPPHELPPQLRNQSLQQSPPSLTKDLDPYTFPHLKRPPSGCTPTTTSPGPAGEDGRPGRLRIINREEPIQPEKPQIQATLSELMEQPLALSRHLWRERQGAADLLAPGSIIADEYQEYIERIETTTQLRWEANQPLSDFETAPATLYLQADGRVLVDLGEELWSLSETRQRDNLTEVVIAALVPEAEVINLATGGFQRSGDTLNLVVIDLAGHSEALDTTFHIHYRSADRHQLETPRANWQTRYRGEVPAAAVTQNHNRFSLDLSQLPIAPQYLRPGVPVQIELTVTRSLGQRSATTTLNWQGEIR